MNPTLPFGIICTSRFVYEEAFDVIHRGLARTTTTLPKVLVDSTDICSSQEVHPLTKIVESLQHIAKDRESQLCIQAYRRGSCSLRDLATVLYQHDWVQWVTTQDQ